MWRGAVSIRENSAGEEDKAVLGEPGSIGWTHATGSDQGLARGPWERDPAGEEEGNFGQ